jgi:hypothetical protein
MEGCVLLALLLCQDTQALGLSFDCPVQPSKFLSLEETWFQESQEHLMDTSDHYAIHLA